MGLPADWFVDLLTENNFKYRHYNNVITILDSHDIGKYQLRIENSDDNYYVHAIQLTVSAPKKTFSPQTTFISIPRKSRLLTVDLHNKDSIPKIERWLKEIQSKLK